jgi:hypothetical protein
VAKEVVVFVYYFHVFFILPFYVHDYWALSRAHEKTVELTKQKGAKREKNSTGLSPRNRKVCHSTSSALLQSVAEIGTQSTIYIVHTKQSICACIFADLSITSVLFTIAMISLQPSN